MVHLHASLFIGPLVCFRCQSGSLILFTRTRLSGEGNVVLFGNAIGVTNIRLRYRNNTSLCSELGAKHYGEGFISLRSILFEIWTCKVSRKSNFSKSISRKFDVRSVITGSNNGLRSKNTLPFASTC